MLSVGSVISWTSSLFTKALWPVCTLPAGGHVSCLCYLCSYSWQQVHSLTFFRQVFSLCCPNPEGVQQPWLHSSWSPVHIGWLVSTLCSWCHCTSAGRWICKLKAGRISMQRSRGTPSVFSNESNFLEQSSTSECSINVSFALMFMLSIPRRQTGRW